MQRAPKLADKPAIYCGNTDPLDMARGFFFKLVFIGVSLSIAGNELNSPRDRYYAGKIAFHAITKAATSTEKVKHRKSEP